MRTARDGRPGATVDTGALAYASGPGRWLVVAAALGSGVAFLDGSVVTLALPAIGRDLGGGFTLAQWVVDGYLLTLGALLLLGGALGDRLGRRRVFLAGLVVFTAASLACGLAPSGAALVVARLVQGVGGALLVPGSLALIDSSIRPADRGRAIGTWAGLAGIASATGPFVGGYLIDVLSWRWVFLLNVPLAAAAALLTLRHAPESRDRRPGRLDVAGSVAVTVGLAGTIFALIEVPARGWDPVSVLAAAAGLIGVVAFPVVERRRSTPLVPPGLFGSAQFVGANLVTLAVYAALGGALFLLALHLQQTLGYPALAAGAATLPMTALLVTLSGRVGALAQRIGPRWPMTVGPVLAAVGLGLLGSVRPGSEYLTGVLPGVTVLGAGIALTAAPLSSAVLASVPAGHVGAASGVNNAVSRIAGLLAVAVLPVVAGIDMSVTGAPLGPGFGPAMWICAGLCAVGGAVAAATVGRGARVHVHPLPAVDHPCTGREVLAPSNGSGRSVAR
ncbi:MFS transporter [Pseudonocardia humida]|uniref:MFS transporter n=1 Tax=Pseudonocardia humida TaxID=2800819 RepID=A0ABT1AAT6_9PSEU|nr:MFS transporter [Pseudonocardia humida]MCO1659924.1 MFS transporter [Pseudonocardia humida]